MMSVSNSVFSLRIKGILRGVTLLALTALTTLTAVEAYSAEAGRFKRRLIRSAHPR